ncbi:MAG: hypothetical protein PHD95_02235 [Candidatus ainarchaeum sp.]|nr:hypothetical protein [Candidatus ainarchaeum sp.]
MARNRRRTRRWFLKGLGLGIGTIATGTALHIATNIPRRKRAEFDLRRDNGNARLSIATINSILHETPLAGKGELICYVTALMAPFFCLFLYA